MRERFVAAATVGTLALAAGILSQPAARAAEPYVINYIGSMTGGAAFLGQGEKQSLALAEKAINAAGGINGRMIQFVLHDDETNPQLAVQLATEIIAAKPAVIFGPSLSATCRAVAPLTKDGPMMYCFSPFGPTDKGSYDFSENISSDAIMTALIRYYRLRGWTHVAFLFGTDATGQTAEAAIKRALALPENATMQAVETQHFNITDVSISAQMEKIKAANPQAFIPWATGAPVATIFRGMVQAGLDVPTGTGDGSMTYAQMSQYAAFLPKQLYIPTSQWIVRDPKLVAPAVAQKIAEFYKYFEAAGIKPDLPLGHGWEVAMLVAGALRNLGPDATAAQLRDYFNKLQGVAGIYGVYDFVNKEPQRGLDVSDAIITLWRPEAQTWVAVSKPGGIPVP